MDTPKVVVVGDLILDLLAKTEGPVAFGTDTFTPIRAAPGGSGANCAAWLARLGVETVFVARVGDDVFADYLAADLQSSGVKTHLARDSQLPTGKVFVLVDGAGERTMITDRGAGANLGPDDLPRNLFAPGAHLHLSGYLLSGGTRRQAALLALRLAREVGMTVSVDPSSVPLLEDIGPENFLRWTTGADLVFPNLSEGALLSGEKEPERIATRLAGLYPGVALKLGPEGALYAGTDGEVVRVPAPPVRVVDTTGAGDAFCAGFLASRLAGDSPKESLLDGTKLAARVISHMGGRPAL